MEVCGTCAGLKISPVGVGAWSWGDRTGLSASAHTDVTHILHLALLKHMHNWQGIGGMAMSIKRLTTLKLTKP